MDTQLLDCANSHITNTSLYNYTDQTPVQAQLASVIRG